MRAAGARWPKLRPDQPIGVFDSGVGGLTVLRALRRTMPEERLLYLGDTARVPYGSKSREAVTRFSIEIGRFLEDRGVKLLVVACNTASALALPALKAALKVPVVGVVQPAVRAAVAATRTGVVGLVGTEATVASGAYQKAARKLSPRVRIVAQACPLLVPLVEEGWWTHEVTQRVAAVYLRPFRRSRGDVLILGCTHYPLLRPLLQRLSGRGVGLIDSGEEAAREVKSQLESHGLRRRGGRGAETFFVTDGPERFRLLAKRFLGGASSPVRLVRFPS